MTPTTKFKDFTSYLTWYKGLSFQDAQDFYNNCKSKIHETPHSSTLRPSHYAFDTMISGCYFEKNWNDFRDKVIEKLKDFHSFAKEYQQDIHVGQWEETLFAFLYIGNPKAGIIVPSPELYLEYIPAPDYSDITPQQLRAQLGIDPTTNGLTTLIPAGAESLTQTKVREQLSVQTDAISDLQNEIDKVKNAETDELAELKRQMEAIEAELEAKKEKLMAELNEKKAEMETMKENLENQIWLLDSQIYNIMCYAGETVSFAKIRSGKNAADTEPIVIHQKLRFLNEDLGQLASLYELQWNEIKQFEHFLKYHPLALETFAPNERCVMLVRLSRSGKQLCNDSDLPYLNLLENYEYYHGKTVGIIIRNGENLYLGWTDENKVQIDDDLIVSQIITETTPYEEKRFTFESERKAYLKEQKQQRKKIMDAIVSRSFIYNILQGIVDHSDILPLPKGITLQRQSEYVIYAVADKWLTDNKYGNFNDIVDRCNQVVQKGDTILTVQHLVPENYDTNGRRTYLTQRWDNVRGRGDKNRTHDCSVDDCHIYNVNLVEYDEPIEMQHYTDASGKDRGWVCKKGASLSEGCIILDEFIRRDRHVFVSVEKEIDWYNSRNRVTDTPARANFEVYDKEFINLTYMNSVWLEWVITNKKLGGWKIGGKEVDYGYAIRYLKTAMDMVRKREATEKELIATEAPEIIKNPEWPVKLSEWKLKNGVRTITAYQARRFARSLLDSY